MAKHAGVRRAPWSWWGLLSVACANEAPPAPDFSINTKDECTVQPDGFVCRGGVAFRCVAGEIASRRDCTEEGLTCGLSQGCQTCEPLSYDCQGNDLVRCNSAGTQLSWERRCAKGLKCSRFGCRDLCADAAERHSYIGCAYLPVFTSNSQLDPVFEPGVAVANPNLVAAHVNLTRAGVTVANVIVERQSAALVPLAFDFRLKGPLPEAGARADAGLFSSHTPDLAYRLVSDVPVTVHQFNPMSFEVDTDCEGPARDDPVDGVCRSYTNDASLLLPVSTLQADYIAVARPSLVFRTSEAIDGTPAWDGLPGFVAVVGAGETGVSVTVRSSAYTLASSDGKVPALVPGDELLVTLERGEVLQLLSAIPRECPGETGDVEREGGLTTMCDPGREYDLTGTEIAADGPVQVLSGHDCAQVPFDSPACDHLEEALFPLETWGRHVIVTRPAALDGEPHVFRVVSGDDGNRISFDPSVHGPVTLDRGEFIELLTDQHVAVTGQKRILVAQFLVGQGASLRAGDPAMGLAVPTDQYRANYVFLSPQTFVDKFVNIIVYDRAGVTLDGESVSGFERVGGSDYSVATLRLSDKAEHIVESPEGAQVGLILYGYAPFTSYMLPAGLDLTVIGPPL